MGRRTYEAMAGYGGGGAGMLSGVKVYVLSRTLKKADHPKVTIVSRRVKETVAALRKEPGKDIWLFGGGALFRSLLEMNLVDTVEVAVIPALLGAGIPLLTGPAHRAKLELTGHKVYAKSGIVSLDYKVKPSRRRAR